MITTAINNPDSPLVENKLQAVVYSQDTQVIDRISKQLVRFLGLHVYYCSTAVEYLTRLNEAGKQAIIAIADVHSTAAETEIIFKALAKKRIPTLLIYDKNKQGTRVSYNNILASIDIANINGTDFISEITENIFNHRKTRIIVMHHDEKYLNYLITLLDSQHYTVMKADTMAEVFEHLILYPTTQLLIAENQADDIINKLRQLHSTNQMSIIAMIAQRDPDTMKRLFEAGVNDVITTSTEDTELLARVNFQAKQTHQYQNQKNQFFKDKLSSIYTEEYFFEIGKRLHALSERSNAVLGFGSINIDNLTKINEEYGVAIGDRVIYLTAQKIKKLTRNTDLIARNANNEFLCLINTKEFEDILISYERIRAEIESSGVWYANIKIPVTVSIGASADLCTDLYSMQTLADTALYQARKSGGNQVVIL